MSNPSLLLTTVGPMPETAPRADCPCCGAPVDPVPKLITDRYGWTWPLGTCRSCGVRYQTAPMTPDARMAFYGSGRYRDLVEAIGGAPRASLLHRQRAYAKRWLPHVVSMDYPMLDYGGSAGGVSQVFTAATSSRREQHKVIVADYADGATTTPESALAVADGHYGSVLCAQTLDHLINPLETLKAFHRVTRPGGLLFVDVVKAQRTALKLDHDTYYLSAGPFLSLVERAGWRVIWLRGDVDPSHYAVLASR